MNIIVVQTTPAMNPANADAKTLPNFILKTLFSLDMKSLISSMFLL